MNTPPQKDLIVLVADKNMLSALEGLLSRVEAIGIRSISYDIYSHPQHDPGCFSKGVDFLSAFQHSYLHGLLIFDYEGSGAEGEEVITIQNKLDEQLNQSGWNGRAISITIDPELENWVWSDSPIVSQELGWAGKFPSLREWMKDKNFVDDEQIKPSNPKEVMEKVLFEVRKPRSSAIYKSLAKRVSFRRCTDVAFLRLLEALQKWFKND